MSTNCIDGCGNDRTQPDGLCDDCRLQNCPKMSHNDLVERAKRWLLKTKGCGFVLSELDYVSTTIEIADAIGWKYGQSHLIECKASRADFLSDKKKPFRRMPWRGMGQYRYYMTTPEIIQPTELPRRWGLLYVHPKVVRIIKEPEIFHYQTTAEREIPLLCSAIRRVHLRGDLEKIYDMGTL
jgi:hypothetical protein